MKPSLIERTLLRGLIGLILGGLACGDAQSPIPRLLAEDFEEACDALPCGWAQIRGDAGQAIWRSTVHSGEHGLLLRGAGVAVRGPGGEPRTALLNFGALDTRVSARCDPGNELVVRVAITALGGTDGGVIAADTMMGSGRPSVDWTGGTIVTLTASTALTPGSPFAGGAGGTFQITGITVDKLGSGECEIDQIVIDDVGVLTPGSPAYEAPEPAC